MTRRSRTEKQDGEQSSYYQEARDGLRQKISLDPDLARYHKVVFNGLIGFYHASEAIRSDQNLVNPTSGKVVSAVGKAGFVAGMLPVVGQVAGPVLDVTAAAMKHWERKQISCSHLNVGNMFLDKDPKDNFLAWHEMSERVATELTIKNLKEIKQAAAEGEREESGLGKFKRVVGFGDHRDPVRNLANGDCRRMTSSILDGCLLGENGESLTIENDPDKIVETLKIKAEKPPQNFSLTRQPALQLAPQQSSRAIEAC